MKETIESFGVPCVYKMYGDEEHERGHVFHLDMRDEIGRMCNDQECDFFKGYIKTEE